MRQVSVVILPSSSLICQPDFHPSSSGCAVLAFDLKTQKQLWKTTLKGLGPIAHFRYANSVNLEIINNNAVRIFGNESAGQYLEIVDLKTGKTVGHQKYKK